MRDAVLRGLADRHTVTVLDLYGQGFNPVLSRQERLDYHDVTKNQAPVADHIALIKAAEAMIFVYPTWWYGLPAMLKGWFDRVWVPGVTFTMPEAGKPIGPLMTHVRHCAIITTYGAPVWWIMLVGDPGVRTLLRGLRPLLNRHCKTFKLAHYLMDSSTPASRAAHLDKIEVRFQRF
jgi:putative NADPH-quinone reductase